MSLSDAASAIDSEPPLAPSELEAGTPRTPPSRSSRTPKSVRDNAPKPVLKQEFDAGHWLTFAGACVMATVVVMGGCAFLLPWWTQTVKDNDGSAYTEVSLWKVTTVREAQVEESIHYGCNNACDQTRIVQNRVTSKHQLWDDLCRNDKSGVYDATCLKLLISRVGIGLVEFLGFAYCAAAVISFGGSEKVGALRFPPVVGLATAIVSFLMLAMAIVSCITVGGHVPQAGREAKDPSDLNGIGFILACVGIVLSIPNMGMAFLAMSVTDEILAEAPPGTPMHSVKAVPLEVRQQAFPRLQTHAWA
eukprot:TRINITY_DN73752_c0_g1_i1.p1 TRINITY_DN73752_c0_g1~~TRINITY_DN73752_c0_g1_i1.p1  ORF type:complete len:305 (+),score=57.39 TRINITY_DN73752_c0_g1_i1:160-1074(+)